MKDIGVGGVHETSKGDVLKGAEEEAWTIRESERG